jgi:hypothetical protein
MGSSNFKQGPFPHSAVQLDGPRCNTAPVDIGLFPAAGDLFTDPDPPQVVHKADKLTVYWSVCNFGLTDQTTAQPNAYTFTPTLLGPPAVTQTPVPFSIPALTHCTCDVESQVFQNTLDPGTYTFALSGALTGSTNRNITP